MSAYDVERMYDAVRIERSEKRVDRTARNRASAEDQAAMDAMTQQVLAEMAGRTKEGGE